MNLQTVLDLGNTHGPSANATGPAPLRHVLSGSFRSISLFLLAFSPSERTISHLQTVPAYGPHQYLAANQHKNRIYTTSWALPPSLSSWNVEHSDSWRVTHINTVPITATSSYITVPPPYKYAYSMGGPTGEVHHIEPDTGGLEEKVQEILFIPEDELEKADKTRKALRYGSHGIEFTPSGQQAFVPVLGTHTIEMYLRDTNGHLKHVFAATSPRGKDANDGPRHVKIHPNGKILYCVTEHSNYVDAYRIYPTSLEYISSSSLLPPDLADSSETFRGDTLMLSPSTSANPTPKVLIATTRGSTSDIRGWLSIFPLDDDGSFKAPPAEIERYQTPTSGGKANAIDISPKGSFSEDGLWILLTDDDDNTASASGTGAVRVLEWDGWGNGGVKMVAEWPSNADDKPADSQEEIIQGASHAIWLD
ncbi:putative isomerase YbhE [Pholiota conissans]|uniref:Isomerase YbhE n=1 Tax=Pholiota conissans TaxID=109636 RepID=A0A9P5YTW9_9AGAR|nr:putative isomerase YbhE [Pholiota conissans]